MKRKCRWTLFSVLVFASCFFIWATSGWVNAQPVIHVVERGDTLWDICERYYGDADLWPKLWQMNPFITNPHLIKPGDKITLLEDVPVKTVTRTRVRQEVAAPKEAPQSAPVETGFDVSGLTDVGTLGFLSTKELVPLGHIFSNKTERVILSKGDTVYVDIGGNGIRLGDLLTVCRKSPMLRHPLTRKKLGHTVSFLGKVVTREALENGRYVAEVVESYRAIGVGDLLLPSRTISSCVRPVPPADPRLSTHVVAVKDSHELIGQSSVVYLANGYRHGIQRGNLLKVVKKKEVGSKTKVALPDLVLGYLLILDSGPETATGVVLSSKQEFSNGALLVGIEGEEALDILSRLPRCSVE